MSSIKINSEKLVVLNRIESNRFPHQIESNCFLFSFGESPITKLGVLSRKPRVLQHPLLQPRTAVGRMGVERCQIEIE